MSKNPADRHQSMDEFREELQYCYGSIAFKRNAARLLGEDAVGVEGRGKRLTDELSEWMNNGDEPQLSLEDARLMAVANAADRSFSDAVPPDEQERLARAVDDALDDD
jgi:hypothetical protein